MPPIRAFRSTGAALLVAACLAAPATAVTPNGRLQIIHLDVGQGDGAVLISPLGQVVMIDDGVYGNPTPASGVKVPQQLQALGVTHVDYHFASHYHADHIGLFGTIFGAGGVATLGYAWDRGGSYSSGTYTTYVNTAGSKRRTLVKNQVLTLDSLSAHPVFIKVIDLNGAGVPGASGDENSSSLQLKVSYGEFDMSFGGDTPGANSGSYRNVESPEAPAMGPIEVYKVHHHGSATSSLTDWLNATQPKVAVVSCGNGNSYGHPTASAIGRLHNAGTHTYWTETGAGVAPLAGWDKVSGGQVVISATWEPGGVDTIRGNGFADTFTNSGTPGGDVQAPVASLTSPVGGETWKVGSSHTLTWTASDNTGVTGVDLAWSVDDGSSWLPIAASAPNTGSYAWVVPATATTEARVRVVARDAAGNLGADSSFSSFTVDWWTVAASAEVGGTITPSGVVGVSEGASATFNISPGTGFTIGDVLVDGVPAGAISSYTFDAVAADHAIAATFLDVAAPVVAVTAPAGGETWAQGSLHDITWTATDNLAVATITIEYSAHGDAGPWEPVASGLDNSGTYAWTVPAVETDSARVRVTAYDPGANSGTAASAALFRIGSGTTAVDAGPLVLALSSPSPNPSAGEARIAFTLPAAGEVRLEIFDLSGRRVWSDEGMMSAGAHARSWNGTTLDGRHAGGGLYFVRLVTPWGTRGERLVRIR
ncbi:MAG: hypothetical protein IT347_01320 [Candidatus Eisenbacteria bacterium]|nr:hypothetical protein [Candidatus Eisenbacteria bacterium]